MTTSIKKPVHIKKNIDGNIDTGLLKILAFLFMLCDHVGVVFFPQILLFRIIGRLAFPLYCWMLVVGATFTKNIFNYILRLLIVGIISQPFYMLALNHRLSELNIFFTLFLGLIAVFFIQLKKGYSHIWGPILCLTFSSFYPYYSIDYGWKGVLFIILLYLAKTDKKSLLSLWIAYSLFWGSSSQSIKSSFDISNIFLNSTGFNQLLSSIFRLQGMTILALPFVYFKTHTKIVLSKKIGYSLYPLHLFFLWAINSLIAFSAL